MTYKLLLYSTMLIKSAFGIISEMHGGPEDLTKAFLNLVTLTPDGQETQTTSEFNAR